MARECDEREIFSLTNSVVDVFAFGNGSRGVLVQRALGSVLLSWIRKTLFAICPKDSLPPLLPRFPLSVSVARLNPLERRNSINAGQKALWDECAQFPLSSSTTFSPNGKYHRFLI